GNGVAARRRCVGRDAVATAVQDVEQGTGPRYARHPLVRRAGSRHEECGDPPSRAEKRVWCERGHRETLRDAPPLRRHSTDSALLGRCNPKASLPRMLGDDADAARLPQGGPSSSSRASRDRFCATLATKVATIPTPSSTSVALATRYRVGPGASTASTPFAAISMIRISVGPSRP